MTEEVDTRPYTLRMVVIDNDLEQPMAAYSNQVYPASDRDATEWPVFSRDQIQGLLDCTQGYHFQPFWVEEIGNYAVVTSYDNNLPEPFDITPYLDDILKMERVDTYDEGRGFAIDYAAKRVIEIDGEQIETFSFDFVGWPFCRALEPSAAFSA